MAQSLVGDTINWRQRLRIDASGVAQAFSFYISVLLIDFLYFRFGGIWLYIYEVYDVWFSKQIAER